MSQKAKVLFFDLETAPMKTYSWGLYQELTGTHMVIEDWYILCWCAKWLNKKEILYSALTDFKGYKPGEPNDKQILKKLWDLLDEADIVVAHNATKFDVKKANARFIINGFTPPSPYKVVDTLTVARSKFKFTSNRLNDIGQYLNLGKKLDTGGFELWVKCMKGDLKAWSKMVKYCKQDVKLLEKVYIKILPYISNHPNMGAYTDDYKRHCPKCSSKKLQKRGFSYTGNGKYQRYQCTSCSGWSRGKKNLREERVKNTN